MSVYTRIEPDEMTAFLAEYDLGALQDYQGISAGIENTNYFVTTTVGRYVLTIFESIGFEDLPYYLDLMAFLAEHGIPSAHPMPDRGGSYLRRFKGKPVSLMQRLRGASVTEPDLVQCRAVGDAMGRLHLEGRAFAGHRDHTRGPHWRRSTAEQLLPHLSPEDGALLRSELELQSQYTRAGLPWGVIHADLFRDNALFVGDGLTGIIDFYYACNSVLLYDLAVTVNDWCIRPDGSLDADKTRGILDAYHRRRPLQDREREVWPVMLRVAALRFWLSRLHDKLFPRHGGQTTIKDPNEFKRILVRHRKQQDNLRSLWV
jgi:homoserine kinase type II